MKSPDDLCSQFYDEGEKICIKKLDDNYILIEGNSKALNFLGNLLISQANFENDDGFQIAPQGPGDKLFTEDSNFGIYIHRK